MKIGNARNLKWGKVTKKPPLKWQIDPENAGTNENEQQEKTENCRNRGTSQPQRVKGGEGGERTFLEEEKAGNHLKRKQKLGK